MATRLIGFLVAISTALASVGCNQADDVYDVSELSAEHLAACQRAADAWEAASGRTVYFVNNPDWHNRIRTVPGTAHDPGFYNRHRDSVFSQEEITLSIRDGESGERAVKECAHEIGHALARNGGHLPSGNTMAADVSGQPEWLEITKEDVDYVTR